MGTQCNNYKDLMVKAFGSSKWGTVTTWFLLMLTGFAMLTFVVIIGSFLPQMGNIPGMAEDAWYGKSGTGGAIMLLMLLPLLAALSSLKSLNALRYTSFAAIVCLLYSMGLVAARAFWQITQEDEKGRANILDEPAKGTGKSTIGLVLMVVGAINTIGASSNCHFNAPTFYTEQKNKKKWTLSTMVGFGLVTFTNVFTGIMGYLAFAGLPVFFSVPGKDTTPEAKIHPMPVVLFSFEKDNYCDKATGKHKFIEYGLTNVWQVAATIAMLSMAVCLTFTVPLIFNAFRGALTDILESYGDPPASKTGTGWGNTKTRRYIITILCVSCITLFGACIVAFDADKIVYILLGLISATSGNSIVYLFPAAASIALHKEKGWLDLDSRFWKQYVLISFAVICSTVGLVSTANDMAEYVCVNPGN